MKKNMIIKKLILLSMCILLGACFAKASDKLWSPDVSDFSISAKGKETGKIEVIINRTDHTNARTTATSGKYFVGYYVYRNDDGPYDEFKLYGIDAFPNSITPTYQEKSNDQATIADTPGTAPVFTSKCTPNTIYYYRVIVMYQEWNGTAFTGDLKAEAKSSWYAAICPSVLVFTP